MPHTTNPLILNVDWLPYEAVGRWLHYGLWVFLGSISGYPERTPARFPRSAKSRSASGQGYPPIRFNRSNSPGPL